MCVIECSLLKSLNKKIFFSISRSELNNVVHYRPHVPMIKFRKGGNPTTAASAVQQASTHPGTAPGRDI